MINAIFQDTDFLVRQISLSAYLAFLIGHACPGQFWNILICISLELLTPCFPHINQDVTTHNVLLHVSQSVLVLFKDSFATDDTVPSSWCKDGVNQALLQWIQWLATTPFSLAHFVWTLLWANYVDIAYMQHGVSCNAMICFGYCSEVDEPNWDQLLIGMGHKLATRKVDRIEPFGAWLDTWRTSKMRLKKFTQVVRRREAWTSESCKRKKVLRT